MKQYVSGLVRSLGPGGNESSAWRKQRVEIVKLTDECKECSKTPKENIKSCHSSIKQHCIPEMSCQQASFIQNLQRLSLRWYTMAASIVGVSRYQTHIVDLVIISSIVPNGRVP